MPSSLTNLFLRITAHATADRVAIIENGTPISYAALLAEAENHSRWLTAQPHFPGSACRIGLDVPAGASYIAIALGILHAGACLVPIPSELSSAERLELIARTRLHGCVSVRAGQPQFIPHFPETFPHEAEFRALSPAFIRFSSGTTGTSKGVVISHASLEARVLAANEGLQIDSHDRILWLLPMAHHFAVSIILYLYHGATTVLCPSLDPVEMLDTAIENQTTVVYASPFHHALLATDSSARPWPTLRLAVSTAAPLTRQTAEKFFTRFGMPLIQALGVIEVGLPILNLRANRTHPTAVGHTLPAFTAELRQNDTLHIRGPGMFDAYFSPWQTRADACPHGWFATGDIAQVSPTGLITILGREKSVIIVNGMKVFPEEIETVLDSHPAVSRSLVTAMPHAIFGALSQAHIIPADSSAPPSRKTLVAWCKAHLSAFKIPARFLITDSLPATASGKLKRM